MRLQWNKKTVCLPEIATCSVNVQRFPEDVKFAFQKLEKKVANKSERQFIGAARVDVSEINYRACMIEMHPGEHAHYGLDYFLIQGGDYVTQKLENWRTNTHLVKEIFEEMEHKFRFDANRPHLEYYKNNKELILMLPFIPREKQLTFDFWDETIAH